MATTRGYPRGQYPRDGVETWNGNDAVGTWNEPGAVDSWGQQDERPDDYRQQPRVAQRATAKPPTPKRVKEEMRPPKRGMDQWMESDFKFGGSRIKRKAVALVLIGSFGSLPLFFMLPSLLTFNTNTIGNSVDDTLGTGAMVCLFLCLLVSPLVTLTRLRWFFPLRRWFGIMMACCGIGDALGAGLFDNFAGSFFQKLTEHTFTLVGFVMVLLVIPLLLTGNPWAQRKLGRYWGTLHKLIYVIWGFLFIHLATLEGFGFQRGTNGSGFPGDGDPIVHQRLYQYCACSLFLLVLRLPPVKQWIAARQSEGRSRLVWLTIAPIFALFIFGMIFIINELIFKGTHSFTENPSNE